MALVPIFVPVAVNHGRNFLNPFGGGRGWDIIWQDNIYRRGLPVDFKVATSVIIVDITRQIRL